MKPLIKIISEHSPEKQSPLFGVAWDYSGERGLYRLSMFDYYDYEDKPSDISAMLRSMADHIDKMQEQYNK